MKKLLFLLMAGLLVISSCDKLIYHYEGIVAFTTYYIGDSSIITEAGTHIIDKKSYEDFEKTCDRRELFVVYHDDIVKDTSIYTYHKEHFVKDGNGVVLVPETIDTTRYLYFIAKKSNATLESMIPGVRWVEGYNSKTFEAKIIPNINMQEVDSIIIDLFYKYH
ncbi:MAG: hypothetical protein IJ911_04215 [Salinivirgaceae bacterium]|nr:hypothetical protein [Salinivirgaceae bacterium]